MPPTSAEARSAEGESTGEAWLGGRERGDPGPQCVCPRGPPRPRSSLGRRLVGCALDSSCTDRCTLALRYSAGCLGLQGLLLKHCPSFTQHYITGGQHLLFLLGRIFFSFSIFLILHSNGRLVCFFDFSRKANYNLHFSLRRPAGIESEKLVHAQGNRFAMRKNTVTSFLDSG